ncbi:MAG: exodeoxyribonuclease III [Gammaproteobacteria bacterium]|jgi:exodeoxyribonuclease-3
MKIITLNANGIRSAHKKGFFTWLQRQRADVVCIQETKAQPEQLIDEILSPKGYFSYFNSAEKKGYSGVAIYTRKQPDDVIIKLGWDHADREGRYIEAVFGKVSIVSLYLPSGSSGEIRQNIKFDFLRRFMPKLKDMLTDNRQYIICGDWNIAHKNIDLKNWRSNQKNSGFLPEEREWIDKLISDVGFVDAFRELNQKPEQYTWWSNRGQSWEKNVGWRLDYQLITPGLRDKITKVRIYKDKRFSDHAPLIIDYDIASKD